MVESCCWISRQLRFDWMWCSTNVALSVFYCWGRGTIWNDWCCYQHRFQGYLNSLTLLTVAFVGAVEEISDWNLREQLEVNFFGTANIIRCVLPGMRKRRSGHIINITGLSIAKKWAGLMIAGQIGTPSLSLLSAAHHAVEGYSEVIFFVTLKLIIGIGLWSIAV